jgi:hypothetical protein
VLLPRAFYSSLVCAYALLYFRGIFLVSKTTAFVHSSPTLSPSSLYFLVCHQEHEKYGYKRGLSKSLEMHDISKKEFESCSLSAHRCSRYDQRTRD